MKDKKVGSEVKMSTKRQKRITKQVRLNVELHKELKSLAVEEGMTISKLLDDFVFTGIQNFIFKSEKRDKPLPDELLKQLQTRQWKREIGGKGKRKYRQKK